jgi:hypothetical protein
LREQARPTANAQIRAPDRAPGSKSANHRQGRLIDRHRHPEALADHRPDEGGVDPDHLGSTIGKSASRVPRVKRGVGLDDVSQQPVPRAGGGHQAAAESTYDPCAHGTLETERVADGNDELADP